MMHSSMHLASKLSGIKLFFLKVYFSIVTCITAHVRTYTLLLNYNFISTYKLFGRHDKKSVYVLFNAQIE